MYLIREKIAYSFIGKLIAKALQASIYKNERLHWVQQRLAELKFN
jgi:hypothetical protein